MILNLIYPRFIEKNPARAAEIKFCRKVNSELGYFTINEVNIQNLFCFGEYMRYVNKNKNVVNIIANADIYFNDTILLCEKIPQDHFWGISRWEHSDMTVEELRASPNEKIALKDLDRNIFMRNKILYNGHSQDVWVFRGECKIKDFSQIQPVPGSDNRLLKLAQEYGYKVGNPGLTIKCVHNHLSGVRHYNKGVKAQGEYLHMVPTTLDAVLLGEAKGHSS